MSRQKTPYLKFKPKELKDLTWRIIIEGWKNCESNREIALSLRESGDADELSASDIHELYSSNHEIAELKGFLNMKIIKAARTNVNEAILIDNDVSTSKWLLERKAADEFSTKSAVALEGAVVEISLDDKEKALQEMLDKYKKGEE